MASVEAPQTDQDGFGRRVFLNRYVAVPVARAVVAAILTSPLTLTATSGERKINQAKAAANAAFQDPTPPVTSPELRAVAREENDLLIQKRGAESIDNNIPRSGIYEQPPAGDIARKALEEDKAARIQAINKELEDLQKAPRFRTAIDGYTQNQQVYQQQVAETRESRSTEQSRLEQEAGLTIPERVGAFFGPSASLVVQYLAVMGAGGIPFAFKRGAWPFPERAQVPPEPHGEEEA